MNSSDALEIVINKIVSSCNDRIDLRLLKHLYEVTDKSNIAEIGPFVGGKSLILGALALENNALFSTFDTFQRQKQKGLSNEQAKTILENNLSILNDTSHITNHIEDSLNSKTIENLENISYFCIDGNHSEIHTINDLKLGKKTLSDNGCIILDDVTPVCPGVLSGLFSFLVDNKDMVPIVCGISHMWIIRRDYQDFWIQHVSNNFPIKMNKELAFGQQTVFTLAESRWI